MMALLELAIGTKIGRIVTGALAVVLAVIGFRVWLAAHDAAKYNQGYSTGSAQERIAWEEQRKRDLAKQAARIAEEQRKIDQIEAENAALESQLVNTQEALETAIHADGADQKPAMSKNVARALNGVGR